MNTQTKRLEYNNRKTNAPAELMLKAILLMSLAVNAVPALADSPLSALNDQSSPESIGDPAAAEAKPSVGIEIVRKLTRAEKEVKLAAQSIINMMNVVQSNNAQISSVKVPSCNYLPILQELQNQNAKVLQPGEAAPVSAKTVFKLQSEDAALSQTVYFL
jgi:antitoxin component of RelBE/YafQ-DinJ toxin-antitoxin module